MPLFDLPHEGPYTIISDEREEIALFAHDKKKYRATRKIGLETWKDAIVEEISPDHFYMFVACVERRKQGTRGLVGMG